MALKGIIKNNHTNGEKIKTIIFNWKEICNKIVSNKKRLRKTQKNLS